MAIKTYSPKKVVVSVAGVPLSNFADGTFVEVEYTDDTWTKEKGADFEITRVHSGGLDGRITITLKASSDSNDFLSALEITDRLSYSGIFPVFIKDNLGRDLATAAEAWIVKAPNLSKGTDVGDREWILDCGEIVMFNGGQD